MLKSGPPIGYWAATLGQSIEAPTPFTSSKSHAI